MMHVKKSYHDSQPATAVLCAIWLLSTLLGSSPSWSRDNFAPDKTDQQIQRKAVVRSTDARLFERSTGGKGKQVEFMDVFFRLSPITTRVPVSRTPGAVEPDGWLDVESFVEWNTRQMVDFEAQSGRKLLRIFDNQSCATHFGTHGKKEAECEEVGYEPPRQPGTNGSYRLLIPVLEKTENDIYQAGFKLIRIRNQEVSAVEKPKDVNPIMKASYVGYDLVLVVDSTASMGKYFRPTTEALGDFVADVKANIPRDEIVPPLRIGLLFYRDRKSQENCDLEYVTKWEVHLTEKTGDVIKALRTSQEAGCLSDEPEEAVLDGLKRALEDTQWTDRHFKVILLVGDAPPHDIFREKNPLKLTTDEIIHIAEEKFVRFLTFKIGEQERAAFENLALKTEDSLRGRFRAIPKDDLPTFKSNLATALTREWGMVLVTRGVAAKRIARDEMIDDGILQSVGGVEDWEIPIIVANLPPESDGGNIPEFVKGWAPAKIQGRSALREHIFMRLGEIRKLNRIFAEINQAIEEGERGGPEALIDQLQITLAAQLGMEPEDVFRTGESLDTILQKADFLPFRTRLLSFEPEVIGTWKPRDYRDLNRSLSEKIRLLREYYDTAGNIRKFGRESYIYVPRALFP